MCIGGETGLSEHPMDLCKSQHKVERLRRQRNSHSLQTSPLYLYMWKNRSTDQFSDCSKIKCEAPKADSSIERQLVNCHSRAEAALCLHFVFSTISIGCWRIHVSLIWCQVLHGALFQWFWNSKMEQMKFFNTEGGVMVIRSCDDCQVQLLQNIANLIGGKRYKTAS